MFLNILRQINWVDIFVLILVFRVCYIAVKSGFPPEFFKFLGTIAAIYLSLHYYTVLSDLIGRWLSRWLSLREKMPLEFLDFVTFTFLAILGYVLFVLLRNVFCHFINIEAVSALNKWGGLFLGMARSILLASLVLFMLVISSVGYFKDSVKASYFGRRLFSVAPETYTWLWDGIGSKFSKGEKYNQVIPEVKDSLSK